ncbi:hypothetical protein C8R43DRAFT_942385 [Mycena crocata]|nr:hypothetical protein C8R43DRAFT_942385 [Mycena crocata]
MRLHKLSTFEATLLSAPEPLLLRILSFWTVQDIIASDTLSSIFHDIVRYYRTRTWNPDVFFRYWFIDHPSSFRNMLKHCGAIVSGSQMIQFFDRVTYFDSDMDIFLRLGGIHPMTRWLETQGYTFDAITPKYTSVSQSVQQALKKKMTLKPTLREDPINTVYNYKRFIASTTIIYAQKIQLITVDLNPIRHILFDFHSTAVMNYMTSDTAVSVFPTSTFIHRKSYMARSRSETENRTIHWQDKYKKREFRLIQKRSRGDHRDLILGKRSSADRYAWIVEMELQNPSAPLPKTPETNSIYGGFETNIRFEVLNWRTGATHTNSFARVAEPGIWRLRTKASKKFPGLLPALETETTTPRFRA